MRFDLAAMTRRIRNPRRKSIPIRDIRPPAVLAANLYAACYAPVIATVQASADRIIAEYGRTLAQTTTDSAADLGVELDGLKGLLDRLLLTLTPRLRDWVLRTEAWHRERWRGAVLSATGVDLKTMIGPEDVAQPMEQIVEWNVALVRDVGDQARQRIASAVFAGLNQRRPARDVAKDIREATGFARDRALRIASDQLTKLTADLDEERRRQAGLSVWKWRHSGKLHPREWHKARDGTLYSSDPAMIGREVEGATVQAEPPADDKPGKPPFCGCRGQGIVVFD